MNHRYRHISKPRTSFSRLKGVLSEIGEGLCRADEDLLQIDDHTRSRLQFLTNNAKANDIIEQIEKLFPSLPGLCRLRRWLASPPDIAYNELLCSRVAYLGIASVIVEEGAFDERRRLQVVSFLSRSVPLLDDCPQLTYLQWRRGNSRPCRFTYQPLYGLGPVLRQSNETCPQLFERTFPDRTPSILPFVSLKSSACTGTDSKGRVSNPSGVIRFGMLLHVPLFPFLIFGL